MRRYGISISKYEKCLIVLLEIKENKPFSVQVQEFRDKEYVNKVWVVTVTVNKVWSVTVTVNKVWANAVCSWSRRLLPHVTTSSAATLLCLHQLCQKQHVTF